jgi:excinuclease UvrABC helicase subunit UvrB
MAEFKFTDDQTFALEQLTGFEDYYTLKGYAGTGKTTVITHWVQQMRERPVLARAQDRAHRTHEQGYGST